VCAIVKLDTRYEAASTLHFQQTKKGKFFMKILPFLFLATLLGTPKVANANTEIREVPASSLKSYQYLYIDSFERKPVNTLYSVTQGDRNADCSYTRFDIDKFGKGQFLDRDKTTINNGRNETIFVVGCSSPQEYLAVRYSRVRTKPECNSWIRLGGAIGDGSGNGKINSIGGGRETTCHVAGSMDAGYSVFIDRKYLAPYQLNFLNTLK
jgi:hypothetical protein